ncbi:MAG: hypothetical protein LBO73_04930 [Holosporaceae bacterium]|jgi:hypothetical protein|nr:hypothetical protein [Holosporaceae bacterium]
MKKYLLLIGFLTGLFLCDGCFGMRAEEETVLEKAYRRCDLILDAVPEILQRQESIRSEIAENASAFLMFCEYVEKEARGNLLTYTADFMIRHRSIWEYFKPLWERSGYNTKLRQAAYLLSSSAEYLAALSERRDMPESLLFPCPKKLENLMKDLCETSHVLDDIINLFQDLDFSFSRQLADYIRNHAYVRPLFKIKDESFKGLAETLILNIFGNICPAKYFFDLLDKEELFCLAEVIFISDDADTVRCFLERFENEDELTLCMNAPGSENKTPLQLLIGRNYRNCEEMTSVLKGENEIFNLLWGKCRKSLLLQCLYYSVPWQNDREREEFHRNALSSYYDFAASFLIGDEPQTPEQENDLKLFTSEFYDVHYAVSVGRFVNQEQIFYVKIGDFLRENLSESSKCAGLLRNLIICLFDRTSTDEAGLVFMRIVKLIIRSINREPLRQILNLRLVNGTDLWDYMEKLLPDVRGLIQNEIPAGIRQQRTAEAQAAAQLTRSQPGRRLTQSRTAEAQSAAQQRERQEQSVHTMPRVQSRTAEAQSAAQQRERQEQPVRTMPARVQPRTAEAQTAAQSAATQPGRQPAQPTAGAQGRRTARIMPNLGRR